MCKSLGVSGFSGMGAVPGSQGGRRRTGKRGLGVEAPLTAEELILGCHRALHDLWLNQARAQPVCIRGVVLRRAGQLLRASQSPAARWLPTCTAYI